MLGKGSAPRPKRSEKELGQLWAQLAEEDASKAFLALKGFLATPDLSVPFLADHLQPVSQEIPPRMARLLADLDNDQFAVRQNAVEQLEKLGPSAEVALRQALSDRPSPEVRRRLEPLLAKVGDPAGSAVSLQLVRALEVLELLASPQARQVIARLAEGSPRSWLTREARASLDRLSRPSPGSP
jgi:hypothetical protein